MSSILHPDSPPSYHRGHVYRHYVLVFALRFDVRTLSLYVASLAGRLVLQLYMHMVWNMNMRVFSKAILLLYTGARGGALNHVWRVTGDW